MVTKKAKPAKRDGRKKAAVLGYKKHFREYLDGKIKLQTYQKIGILLLVVVFAGMAGWFWEFALVEIGGHFQHLYIKGGNLLPWMNIYAYGAILIMVVSCKLKKYPWAVFVVSAVACGLLELFAGWVVYTVGNGTRYWDYSHEWWAVGNINGFVCPVSAMAFGLGALALMYWLLPRVIYMARKMTRRAFLVLSITLFTVVMVDDITNLILKNLGLPTAQNFYETLGWKFKT
ncbi:putative ABC transporter permease [Candidatus Saccharibacteria bacterium]|nr:putative ABC transporter permease [Candidatus Saccharibacteria bacterium]